MSALQKYTPFFYAALLMCVVLCIIYPHYQYYVDPDGTAYLTISQRYANGDYATAVNGYWSPWGCWLTALLIKAGLAAIPASVVVNAVGGVGFLYISQSFFLKFSMERKVQVVLNITLALFLCYAVFWQSFDDLWECFFLLAALRLMLADGFKSKPQLWILYGMVGTLAYFAKAYSFPFFILNTLVCAFFLCKDDKVQWLKISLISIGVMVLCGLPWIMALHNKYGIWTTSTSGTLNTSWYLVGHPQWKDGIGALIPPAYKDSPYYWEDPYMANGATPHFWNSWHLFGLQLVRIGLNLWKLLKSMLQLSVLFIFSANLFLRAVVNKKDRSPSIYINVVARSFILFPLGYLLVNFEPRYIWYMLPLGMLLGGLFFQNFVKHKGRQDLMFFIYIFAFSFLIYPVWCMADMYHEGKNEYAIAQQLKKLHIQGSFTGVAEPGKGAQRIERMAYFSGNSYYSIPAKDVQQAEILKEMRRYHVKYYFAYTSYPGYRTEAFDPIFTDEEGKPFPEVTNGSINGLRVFLVNQ